MLCLLLSFLQLAELLCCREPCFLISARLRLPGLYFKMALYLTPFSQVICASDLSFPRHIALHFVARTLFVFKWAFRVVAQVFPSHWFPFWLTKEDGCEEQLREDAFILLFSWSCGILQWREGLLLLPVLLFLEKLLNAVDCIELYWCPIYLHKKMNALLKLLLLLHLDVLFCITVRPGADCCCWRWSAMCFPGIWIWRRFIFIVYFSFFLATKHFLPLPFPLIGVQCTYSIDFADKLGVLSECIAFF